MDSLTFTNLKGGSGKTTSAAALGALCESCLLVDLDPQASLTRAVGLKPSPGAAELFTDGTLHVEPTEWDHLDLLPSDRSLERHSGLSPAVISRKLESVLQKASGHYKTCLIDVGPAAGPLVLGALMATGKAAVPVASGRGALEGLRDLEALLRQTGAAHIDRCFACRIDLRTRHDTDLSKELSEHARAASVFVRETTRAREAEAAGVPLTLFAPDCTASEDYQQLHKELDL